ncbi:amino acid ABC transporter permease [Acidisphaera sp. L21]|uniref:amino acid ABC transporter permease n=1 Tax=Acidisphaera sp. L21 TaxID=1641851 RepID=UPI00131A6EA4|nr:amino acid ABC transporter permease [Acidisphaera sp. L21]
MRSFLRLRALVNSPVNIGITLACLALLAWMVPPLLHWAVLDAAWSGGPEACRAAAGACWPYVGQKYGFFLFGFYPSEARWRPLLALLLMLALLAGNLVPRFWNRRLLIAWPIILALVVWILGGGLGLPPVPTESWSGLPLTLLIASFALVLGFPLGVLLALGRTSKLPFFRMVCTVFIELQRGLPLVAVLFMASVMMPLLVPAGVTPGKLLRAYLAFTLVAAAFIAEIIRGGLQAVAPGQAEAATALGLGYWRTMQRIVLPQCLRVSVPSLVGVAISFFKDTSLVTVIGLTDLLGAVGAASRDPVWLGHDVEGYVFAALVYFTFCFSASRYAAWLERRLQDGARIARAAAVEQAYASRLAIRSEASTA